MPPLAMAPAYMDISDTGHRHLVAQAASAVHQESNLGRVTY
jgi:hypothetical protein